MGQSAVRSSDGTSSRIQEVRLNRARSDNLFDDVVEVREPPPTSRSEARANPTSSWSSRRARCTAARHHGVVVPSFSATKGGSVLQVTTALMFIVGVCMGIVQTVPILSAANAHRTISSDWRRGCGRLPPRPSTTAANCARASTGSSCATSCSTTSTNRPKPCSRWGRWISPCGSAISSSLPRQRFGQIDAAEGALRPVSAGFRRDSARRGACRREQSRCLPLADCRDFRDYHCFSGSMAWPIRTPQRSIGC